MNVLEYYFLRCRQALVGKNKPRIKEQWFEGLNKRANRVENRRKVDSYMEDGNIQLWEDFGRVMINLAERTRPQSAGFPQLLWDVSERMASKYWKLNRENKRFDNNLRRTSLLLDDRFGTKQKMRDKDAIYRHIWEIFPNLLDGNKWCHTLATAS